MQPPEKNKLLGGLIAGDFNSGSHNGTVSAWNVNEVCVDMNAPLVGALGYILSKKAPVKMEGEEKEEEEEKQDSIDVVRHIKNVSGIKLFQNGATISLSGMDASSFLVQVFDLKGQMLESFQGDRNNATFSIKSKGVLQVRIVAPKARHTFTIKSL